VENPLHPNRSYNFCVVFAQCLLIVTGNMLMVMNLYSTSPFGKFKINALYKQVIFGWDRTPAYTGTAGSRYQSISDNTQRMNEWNEASFTPYSLRIVCWFLLRATGLWTLKGCETGLKFIVLIREDLKVLTICGCNNQMQHFLLSYFKTPSVGPAGVELTTSLMAARCSTNWATGERLLRIMLSNVRMT